MRISVTQKHIEGALQWAALLSEERSGAGQSIGRNDPVARAIQSALGNPFIDVTYSEVQFRGKAVPLGERAQRVTRLVPRLWGTVEPFTFELPLSTRERRFWQI